MLIRSNSISINFLELDVQLLLCLENKCCWVDRNFRLRRIQDDLVILYELSYGQFYLSEGEFSSWTHPRSFAESQKGCLVSKFPLILRESFRIECFGIRIDFIVPGRKAINLWCYGQTLLNSHVNRVDWNHNIHSWWTDKGSRLSWQKRHFIWFRASLGHQKPRWVKTHCFWEINN